MRKVRFAIIVEPVTRDEVRRVIGYCRVSTTEQEQSGLGLEAQRAAIEIECQRRGWELVATYTDVASGKSTNGRHELASALAELRAKRADALISTKLDRISRSVVDFGRLLELATKQGWALVLMDLGLDMSTPVGEMVGGMLASVAQFERKRIGERTREALAAVKKRGTVGGKPATKSGKPVGRPRQTPSKVESMVIGWRRKGVTLQAIADRLTAQAIPTPRGGATWSPGTIQWIVQRHETPDFPRGRRQQAAKPRLSAPPAKP